VNDVEHDSAGTAAKARSREPASRLTRATDGGHYFGVFLGLVAGLSWGTTSLSSRYLAHFRNISPPVTVFWRFALAAPLVYAAYRLWTRGARAFEWKDLPRMAGLAALGIFAMANFAFYATKYTTNINVTIIVTASAVLIALIAFARGARFSASQWIGIVIGLVGLILISFAKNPAEKELPLASHILGIGLAVLASLAWALYTYFGGGMVEKYGGLRTTVWAVAIGALMQAPLAIFHGVLPAAKTFTAGDWAVMGYLAVVPTALAFAVWFMALKHIDATTLGVTQYVSPVISASLGWLWLGEPILWEHIVSALLIFAGLRFATKAATREAPRGENRELKAPSNVL